MSAREMAARADWTRANCPDLRPSPQGLYTRRVLVQEIPEGRPTFKKGDRVESVCNSKCRVVDDPVLVCGIWYVPIVLETDSDGVTPMLRSPVALTPIPPETSRLIRVTGPEDAVGQVVAYASEVGKAHERPVRVEVVE